MIFGRRLSDASAGEPLAADVVRVNSRDINSVENIALDCISTSPTLQPVNPGYATPMGPLLLDFPSMAPALAFAEVLPKRQRTLSEFTQKSFDLDADSGDLLKVFWDTLEGSPSNGFEMTFSTTAKTKTKAKAKSSASATPYPKTRPTPSPTRRKPTQKNAQVKQVKAQTLKPASLLGSKATKQKRSETLLVAADKPIKRNPGRVSIDTAVEGGYVYPGPYSSAMRKQKVASYLEKRKRRVWKKEIKYNCRKQFAESRPRVGGRFVPKNKPSEPPLTSPDSVNLLAVEALTPIEILDHL